IKLSISSESLLVSFIEEGIHIRLNSENYIHVQIISYLGTGREFIVFLVQVCDYEIKDAVLKIEVCKDIEISQVYHEILALQTLTIIQDYGRLCQIIGIIKFERKISLLELINKLKGELRLFVESVKDAKHIRSFSVRSILNLSDSNVDRVIASPESKAKF
ncbi:21938_t:CDS:2, partial [Gigaspora margarita]